MVAHRKAWHDSRKMTPGVLAHYKAPLQVEGWDRALLEVRAQQLHDVDACDIKASIDPSTTSISGGMSS